MLLQLLCVWSCAECSKVSNDPTFTKKLGTIIRLRQNPPEHAPYRAWTRGAQIQALERKLSGLPLKKGHGATVTHYWKHNGRTTRFGTIDTATGEVCGLCQQRHRHQQWLCFLRMIDQANRQRTNFDRSATITPLTTFSSPALAAETQPIPFPLHADLDFLAQNCLNDSSAISDILGKVTRTRTALDK